MISLFTKYKVCPLNVVTLPSYCVSAKEANNLQAKREAQLKWMREKGMAYLGDPLQPIDMKKVEKPRLSITPVRLVSVRKDAPEAQPGADSAREA